MTCLFRRIPLMLLLIIGFSTPAVSAESPSYPETGISDEKLGKAIKAAEDSTQLRKETKEKLIKLYKSTAEQQKKRAALNEKADAFIHIGKTAPGELKVIREELLKQEESPATQLPELAEDVTATELEQLLLTQKSVVSAAQSTNTRLDQQLTSLKQRPEAIRQQLANANQQLQDVLREITFPPPDKQLPQLSEAIQWNLSAQSAALNSEIEMLKQEQLSHTARLELLHARQVQAAAEIERSNVLMNLLENKLIEVRHRDIDLAKQKTQSEIEESAGKHPLVQELAKRNELLSGELEQISRELESLAQKTEQTTATARKIEEDYRLTREKVEIAGLSHVLGQVLLDHRRNLPDTKSYRKQSKIRQELTAKSGLRQIKNIEEQQQLSNSDHYVEQLTAGITPPTTESINADLLRLTDSRRELLTKSITLDSAFLMKLEEADRAYRHTLEVVESYDRFLAKHLLWVRNAPAPTVENLKTMGRQFGWLVSPSLWLESLRALLSSGIETPYLAASLILFVLLRVNAGKLRRSIEKSGEPVGKPMEDKFFYTLKAILASLLLALPWPLLMGTAGWQIGLSAESTPFSKAVSEGLHETAYIFFSLRLFYIICMPGGLAAAHFRQPKASVELLRSETKRLMLSFLPIIFLTITSFQYSDIPMEQGIGRASIILTLLVIGAFSYRLFGSRKAVERLQARFPQLKLASRRWLWASVTLFIPAALIVLAIFGYIYSAAVIITNLLQTLWLALGLYVLQQIAVRWLTLSHRRLAFKALLERQKNTSDHESRSTSTEHTEPPATDDEKDYNLSALTQQSRKLLDVAFFFAAVTGLWLIWSELLPAFTLLEDIRLWHYTDIIAGQEQHVAITLGTLIQTIVLIIVTIIAAKNIPALLEIVLRQSFGVLAGNRYAITTLIKYLIATIGTIVIFSNLGGSWSQMQWLVAALGVGIGFGLQEIIANFICGLIILFERPIRVGDFVTVGDTSSDTGNSTGTVTRIRIRATTILTRDRQELLVPNKEFITCRLLNWSLTDETVRVVLPVGIAYGSDVKTAMALILQVARENDNVLEEPKPSVTFESFGDSSLTVILRCFLESVDYRLETTSQLHEAINEKLIAANIEIAFPQQDVHLDISHPLEVRIQGHGGSMPDKMEPLTE